MTWKAFAASMPHVSSLSKLTMSCIISYPFVWVRKTNAFANYNVRKARDGLPMLGAQDPPCVCRGLFLKSTYRLPQNLRMRLFDDRSIPCLIRRQ